MNFKKSILILALFFFATMQSQTMVTTNIHSRLLNKYWCPNVGEPYEVVFFFTQNEVTLFVGNKKIGSEPYYITSNTEVTTPTTFDNAKVGLTSSGNCIKTNSSYYIVEFLSDFKSFRWKRSFDPAQIWQTYTLKSTPFFNIAKSGTFTRNNCGTGNVGMVGVYDVEAGKHISYVSQADADTKAQADVNTNGQNFVNGEPHVYCEYYNVETTRNVRKNNCLSGQVGSLVSYTVPARTLMSEISEDDLAKNVDAYINTYGQIYANAQGTCGYSNVEVCRNLTRNNCPTGAVNYIPTSMYCVKAGKYFAVSQGEVDRLVQLEFDTDGQKYVNSTGGCIFKNTSITSTFTKKDCTPGKLGTAYNYTSDSNTYSSTISQADADANARTKHEYWGQYYANYYGKCGTYLNKVKSGTFTRNNCYLGGVPAVVTYTVPSGKYISDISQADADAKAQADVNANGQHNANVVGACTFKNTAKSVVFTKIGCDIGGIGSSVTYVVAAGKHTSTKSQDDANALAQADVTANGQSNANAKGTCTFKSKALTNVGFRKVCTSPKVGSIVLYSATAGAFTSPASQTAADALAQKAGQDNANLKGTCN